MVHTFKFGGQRIAYDSVSGLVLPLSELAYKMLDYIELPMASECSSALRYDLAKYDSAAVSETYDKLYTLYREGKLFAEGGDEVAGTKSGGAAIKIGDTAYGRGMGSVYDALLDLADRDESVGVDIVWSPEGTAPYSDEDLPTVLKDLEKIAKTQAKRLRTGEGKPFCAFMQKPPCVHNDGVCKSCWAVKLCALQSPHSIMCELERKRIECVMMVETSSSEE